MKKKKKKVKLTNGKYKQADGPYIIRTEIMELESISKRLIIIQKKKSVVSKLFHLRFMWTFGCCLQNILKN
jgi:hypothetical protein